MKQIQNDKTWKETHLGSVPFVPGHCARGIPHHHCAVRRAGEQTNAPLKVQAVFSESLRQKMGGPGEEGTERKAQDNHGGQKSCQQEEFEGMTYSESMRLALKRTHCNTECQSENPESQESVTRPNLKIKDASLKTFK